MGSGFCVGVAQVGAGYTTCLSGEDRAALIDAGGQSQSIARNALDRLRFHHRRDYWFGGPREPWGTPHGEFTELVISHPHIDHYCGLLAFADGSVRRPPPTALLSDGATFFHPRIPDNRQASALLMRLAALNQVLDGVPEYALGRAVAKVSAGLTKRVPLARGATGIRLGGQAVEVLWPPKRLDPSSASRLQRLVDAYDNLADDALSHGDRRLVRALETVREPAADVASDALYRIPEDHLAEPDDLERMPEARSEGESSPDDVLHRRLIELKRAITQGANLLSLALTTTPQRYVFLGDLDASLHGEVVADLVDEPHSVLVSAHHGTHFGPDLSRLKSRFVISSVGGPLSAKVKPEYNEVGMHLRTDRAGDLSVWVEDDGTTHLRSCSCSLLNE